MVYTCARCGDTFKTKYYLDRHLSKKQLCELKLGVNVLPIKEINNASNIMCQYCNQRFTRIDNLTRHLDKCKMKGVDKQAKFFKEALHELKIDQEKILEKIEEKDKKLDETTKQIDKKLDETTKEMKEIIQNSINIKNYSQIDQKNKLLAIDVEIKNKKVLDSDRNKYDYKLVEVEKYEVPDLSKITIDDILNILGEDCQTIYDADKKLLENFYLKSAIGKTSNIRLADLKRNKMLMSIDDNSWDNNKESHKECSTILEHIGSVCYTKLCEYYNDKMKEFNLITDDDLEKIMKISDDPKYKNLWKIHLITTGHFLKNLNFSRENNVSTYIHDFQIPKNAFFKGGRLYIKEERTINAKQIELII
jgi:DNA-directed RNA polymerase subunit RPC12/RpoP